MRSSQSDIIVNEASHFYTILFISLAHFMKELKMFVFALRHSLFFETCLRLKFQMPAVA